MTVVEAGFDKVTAVSDSRFESRLSRLLEEPTDEEPTSEEPLPSILAEDDEDRVFTNGEGSPPLTFDAAKEPDVSPSLHVTADDAPVPMIHGDKDLLVPIEHSQNILPVFEKEGVKSKLVTIEGTAHGFSNEQNVKTVLPAMVGWFEEKLAEKK